MLNKIPKVLSPDTIKYLMEMGHGDEVIISDANFPRLGCPATVIRADGHDIPTILSAILDLMPLDTYEPAATLMALVPGDDYKPVIWETYKTVLKTYGYQGDIVHMERYAFYEKARKSYMVIVTSEMSLYANIVLKKGIVK